MSVIGFQRDITDLFNYPGDENPTTQADYISAVKNWVETIKNLVDCNLWQPETEYSVGNYLRTPSLPPQYVLRCVASGISGTEEPDYTNVEIGDTIADGSTEWTLQTMVSLNELDAYFAEIIARIENGEGVVDTMWETDLETDIQPKSATNVVPKVNCTGTLGTANKEWANVYANDLTISGTATAVNLSVSGTATVVTPTPGDDSTKIATTEFVQDVAQDTKDEAQNYTDGKLTEEVTRADGKYRPLSDKTIILNDESVEEIPAGADLNDYTNAGTYKTAGSAVTNSLSNCPTTGQALKLIVLYNGYNHIAYGGKQIISSGNRIYVRSWSGSAGSGSWGDWSDLERVSSSGSNYIRYNSGVQICWGYLTLSTTSSSTVNFGAAFNNNPGISGSLVKQNQTWRVFSISDTKFSVSCTDSANNNSFSWVAVGTWK